MFDDYCVCMASIKYGAITYSLAAETDEVNARLSWRLDHMLKEGGLLWLTLSDNSTVALGFPTGVEVVYNGVAPWDEDEPDVGLTFA